MKGKLKFKINVAILSIAMLTIGLFFAFSNSNNKARNLNQVSAAHIVKTIDGKQYSALLEENVILSVERVNIKSDLTDETAPSGSTQFLGRDKADGSKNPYNFYDISENGKSKQVIADDSLVMLNNNYQSGEYVNNNGGSDAVMVSFGQYVYGINPSTEKVEVKNPKYGITEDSESSQITYLKMDIYFNGNLIDPAEDTRYQLREVRSPISGLYFDFMFLIQQKDNVEIEGHYKLEYEYTKDGKNHKEQFEFFIACRSSYENVKTIDQQSYTSKPTLGWSEGRNYREQTEKDGIVNYYEGKSGISNNATESGYTSTISYPTLTFDYTRYKVSYYHTINGNKISYDVSFDKDSRKLNIVSSEAIYSSSQTMDNYTAGDSANLVSLVFTELGFYQFDFKYIYIFNSGSNKTPSMDHLSIQSKKLIIHGIDLNYSRQGNESAEFRKLKFSSATNVKENVFAGVDLVVMNGVTEENQDKLKNQDLGVLYSIDRTPRNVTLEKAVRVGEVVLDSDDLADRTEDTLQNNAINFEYNLVPYTAQNVYEKLLNLASIDEDFITSFINSLSFINTNQGSIWINANDNLSKIVDGHITGAVDDGGSFYYYKETKFSDIADFQSTAKPYNNQTIFNKVGYYIVVAKLQVDKLKETIAEDFYQIYAFKYTSDTIDITVKTVGQDKVKNTADDEVISAGGYTRDNVWVSWTEPKTFESKIKAYYYQQTATDSAQPLGREELLKLSANEIENENNLLGENVSTGKYSKLLVKLERAGKSATYKAFTIDRQDISGVISQLVIQKESYGTKFYSYAINAENKKTTIENGITDSSATIFWNEKLSGATISATYSFTPFVKSTSMSVEAKQIRQSGDYWISTKYQLGSTQTGYSYAKNESILEVESHSVLTDQGIYIFTIVDEAGNGCKYVLIVDKTEGYIEIFNNFDDDDTSNDVTEYLSEAFKLYGNSVSYNVGTHKSISLDGATNEELKNLISAERIENYEYEGYKLIKNSSYINNLKNLFQTEEGVNYLTVRNNTVYIYDRNIKISESNSTSGLIVNNEKATSIFRTIYVKSENNKYSSVFVVPTDSKTWANIEVNLDNSRGMVYYSNTAFDVNTIDALADIGESKSGVVHRLKEVKSIETADGSKDKYFAFTFLYGRTPFKVASVTYEYYELDLDNSVFDSGTYFYTLATLADGGIIYDSLNPIDSTADNSRGFYMFSTNIHDDTTRAGLYCVTRTYEDNLDYGNDKKEVKYYFIVDRNSIIDVTNKIGTEIKINLLEDENFLSGNDFSLVSSTPNNISVTVGNKEIKEDNYYTYLKTNKLPAVLDIPYSKYIKEASLNNYNSSKGYYAGRLKVTILFKDKFNQIPLDDKVYLIYDSDTMIDSLDVYNSNEEFFSVDIYDYLIKTQQAALANKLCYKDSENQHWLCLQGEYVMIISDNIETTSNIQTKKIIGFEIIEEVYPKVDLAAGFKSDALGDIEESGDSGQYRLTTNKEYVQVVIPDYISLSETAKVDDLYIMVNEQFNGSSTNYRHEFNNEYKDTGADSFATIKNDADNNLILTLKTRLTNSAGEVILENLDKPLVYTITVRYKVGNNSRKYENCYYYYETPESDERTYYAYSTFTVTIDRLAPTENVDKLIESDMLIKKGYVSSDLFEASYYNPSQYYFTYQYKNYDYKQQNTLEEIYAFNVKSETKILEKDTNFTKNKDLNRVYFEKYESDLKNLRLQLPVLDIGSLSNGIDVKSYNRDLTYGELFDYSAGIYIVYEVDAAENITQYVVNYNDGTPVFKLNFDYSPAGGGSEKEGFVGTDAETVINLFDIATTDGSLDLSKIWIENTNDHFFNVSVTSTIPNWKKLSINTNFKDLTVDTFKDLMQTINENFGEYTIVVSDRFGNSYITIINHYDRNNLKPMDASKMIKQREDGSYYIKLNEIVRLDNGVFNYATSVEIIENGFIDIRNTYICVIDENGQYKYYNKDTNELVENNILNCKSSTTYKIIITDVFGNKNATTFNTSGKKFYTLIPDEGFTYFTDEDGTIYTASGLVLEYDTIFELSTSEVVVYVNDIRVENFADYYEISTEGKYNRITLKYASGNIVKYHFQFRDGDHEIDESYTIVVDTKTKPVTFTEISGKARNYNLYENIDLSDIKKLDDCISESSVDKVMNLAWETDMRDYFNYSYKLYQKMKNGDIEEINIVNLTSIELATQGESSGAYWFVITVLDQNNNVVGNKIYSFDVQPSRNKLVYVSKENVAIDRTTVFMKNELNGIVLINDDKGELVVGDITKEKIDLYIANQELQVKKTRENIELTPYSSVLINTQEMGKWILTVYEIKTSTNFKDYLAVLQVPETDKLVGKIYANVIGESSTSGNELMKEQTIVHAKVEDKISITTNNLIYAFDLTNPAQKFASKNYVNMSISYEVNEIQNFVATTKFAGEYFVTGNGNYQFKFVDLAGNVHKFTDEGREYVNVYALREIVLTLDDCTAIENGYYNNKVKLDVYASKRFETASIWVKVYKNSKEVMQTQELPCVISGYGVFTVVVTAKYKAGDGVIYDISKTIEFTIVNENEAKRTMDLTNFSKYEIVKVVKYLDEDNETEDITNVFKSVVIDQNQTGLMISYDKIFANAEVLGVSSGKMKYTITFIIKDEIYPEFEHEVSFTLNNEMPKINCSLEPGEKTTKGFEITFNPSVIFDMVGESYISINDKIVYEILDGKVADLITIAKTFKADGDGDYYVKLVTASGTVLQSFKVEIKEPLNASAIIVIVVVVAIILTVTITIIVLRRKMRIR